LLTDRLLQTVNYSPIETIQDMNEPTFDLVTAHRWFASSLNNQAWELLEFGSRTE